MTGKLWDTPMRNQHQAVDNDGNPDPFALNDCGEEACSMVIFMQGHDLLSAGQIRQDFPQDNSDGFTNSQGLVDILSHFNIPAHAGTPGPVHILPVIERQYAAACFTIVLGYYAGPNELHWVLVLDTQGDNVVYNDPWDGLRHSVPKTWFRNLYAGETVEVHAKVVRRRPFPVPYRDI